MSQPTIQLPSAVAFAQEQAVSRKDEDLDLKRLARKNSFFSPSNLRGMITGLKRLSAENVTYLILATVFSPVIIFGGNRLLGIMQPLVVTIIFSAAVPLAVLGIFLYANANKSMTAKRKALAATRRVAEHLDRKDRPVLTVEYVAVREKLDELFAWDNSGLNKDERLVLSDSVFALILEDFSQADVVLGIVETRGIYVADQIRDVLGEMQQVTTPLLDGAL